MKIAYDENPRSWLLEVEVKFFCFGFAVLVRRTVRVGGNVESERDESSTKPVACFLLIRTCPAEHMFENMGRQS